jgi:hypothetical protein
MPWELILWDLDYEKENSTITYVVMNEMRQNRCELWIDRDTSGNGEVLSRNNEIGKTAKILNLCKIWGFHGGDYEERCLLGCYAAWLL